jgi:ribosome-associated heat shock protein Hsp15
MPGQRLDRWLWCARLVKTRSLGAKLIAAGKVRVNGARTLKPARAILPGDVVTASLGRLFVVRVIGAVERRVSPSVAQTLYEDLAPPAAASTEPTLKTTAHRGPRPTKRDRRRLDAWQTEQI